MSATIFNQKKIIFSLGFLIVLFIGLETYARFRNYAVSGNSKDIWGTPNTVRTFELNKQGFRGKEANKKKPKDLFRIVTLGGSSTQGWGIELDSQTWPARLETWLKENSDNGHYEVLNLASDHSGSEGILKKQLPLSLAFNPNLVIIFSGYNDYGRAYELASQNSPPNRAKGVDPNEGKGDAIEGKVIDRAALFVLEYSFFAQRFREWIAKYWYGDINHFYPRANSNREAYEQQLQEARKLENSSELLSINIPEMIGHYKLNMTSIISRLKKEKSSVMLMSLPVHSKHPDAQHYIQSGSHNALNDAIRALAIEQRVSFCDVETVFKGHPDVDKLFIWGWSYPDSSGTTLIANTLYGCLKKSEMIPSSS